MQRIRNIKDATAVLRSTGLEPEELAYALRLLGYSAPEAAPKRDDSSSYNALIGGTYLFRSVTMYVVGKVQSRMGTFIELADASWVADTGKFSEAIANGELSHVEPTGKHYLNLDTVVDFVPWNHKLPKEKW